MISSKHNVVNHSVARGRSEATEGRSECPKGRKDERGLWRGFPTRLERSGMAIMSTMGGVGVGVSNVDAGVGGHCIHTF